MSSVVTFHFFATVPLPVGRFFKTQGWFSEHNLPSVSLNGPCAINCEVQRKTQWDTCGLIYNYGRLIYSTKKSPHKEYANWWRGGKKYRLKISKLVCSEWFLWQRFNYGYAGWSESQFCKLLIGHNNLHRFLHMTQVVLGPVSAHNSASLICLSLESEPQGWNTDDTRHWNLKGWAVGMLTATCEAKINDFEF